MAHHRPFASQSSLSDPRGAGPPLTLTVDIPGGDRPSDFPALAGLASLGPADPLLHPESGPSRQQRGRLLPIEPRRHRRLQIREHRPSLLTARRHHRPDPLAPPVAALHPRPLRDPPVDHHEPDRPLCQVVRRLDAGLREEPETAVPVAPPAASPGRYWPPPPAGRASRAAGPRPAPPPAAARTPAASSPSADGSPRRAPAAPRAGPPRTPDPARRAASRRTSRRGSGGPGRTAARRRT